MQPASLPARKADLRAKALAARDALHPDFRIEASLKLAEHFPFDAVSVAGKTVSGFLPILSEIDVRPLMEALAARGARLALPVFAARGVPMTFRLMQRGAPLVPMGFGTRGPGPEAPEVEPDILLVPLAAFDAHGNRIGYGKGHYDGALARLDATRRRMAIGVAFSTQEVDEAAAEPHDRALDALITEAGFRAWR